MSVETNAVATLEKEEVAKKTRSEKLLSKRRRKLVNDPLNEENPITIQVLGICSALAITIKMEPTIIMAMGVIFTLVFSNLFISLIRKWIPNRIRIMVQLVVIALFVTLVSEFLKAFNYPMYKVLGAFVGLIITNCIIMGRLEAFAMGNKPYDSVLDGLGSGLGYSWVILAVAFFRELFGSGSILNFKIFDKAGIPYINNGLMVDSIGAFMILAIIIWIQRTRTGYIEN